MTLDGQCLQVAQYLGIQLLDQAGCCCALCVAHASVGHHPGPKQTACRVQQSAHRICVLPAIERALLLQQQGVKTRAKLLCSNCKGCKMLLLATQEGVPKPKGMTTGQIVWVFG